MVHLNSSAIPTSAKSRERLCGVRQANKRQISVWRSQCRILSEDVRTTKSDYKVVSISECPVDSHCEQHLSRDVSAVSSTEQSVVSDLAEVYATAV